MPGQTNNTDILNAINQTITALNDLAGEFGGQLATLETNSEAAGDNIESLRSTLETRSIAETTAANTNFAALTSAIGNLALTCAPVVNVASAVPDIILSCPAPVVNVTYTSVPTGTKIDDSAITGTDTPPPGYEPDSSIHDRQCRAANYVYDDLHRTILTWDINDYDVLAQTAVVTATTMIGYTLGNGPGAVLGAALGIASTMAVELALDLADMLSVLELSKDELICIMASAPETSNTESIREQMLDVLDANGYTPVEIELITYLLPNEQLRVLWQAIPGSEAALDGAYQDADCSECVPLNHVEASVIVGVQLDEGNNWWSGEGEYTSSVPQYWIIVDFYEPVILTTLTTSIQMWSYKLESPVGTTQYYNTSGVAPILPYQPVTRVAVQRRLPSQQFTMYLEWEKIT